jgi:lysophospholipase L1-like esterase
MAPPDSARFSQGRFPWQAVPILASAVMALFGILAAFSLAEVVLRAGHFQFQAIPTVQFGWPQPDVIRNELQPDPDVFWVTRDYQMKLGRARSEHARVVFMGDSCVEFSSYPLRTLQRLGRLDPTLKVGEKLGVAGWSSEQGRVQMVRDVLPLRPRVITIQFGWNDHWDALGPSDDQTHHGRFTLWASEHLRVYQAYRQAVVGLGSRLQSDRPRRVGLDRYRQNLRVMAEAGQRIGARVVFITAPTDHEAGFEPSYLKARHLKDLSSLVPLHESYAQATREVAASSGAWLCDAASTIARLGRVKRRYFRRDGIHFTEAGDVYMGDLVAGCIEAALR